MLYERFNTILDMPGTTTAEKPLRTSVKHLVIQCNGLFGKVVADLIAEGQGDPSILKELYESHILPRRASTVEDIQRGSRRGELLSTADPELLLDAIAATIYLRLLLGRSGVTEQYGNQRIDGALLGVQNPLEGATREQTGRRTAGIVGSRHPLSDRQRSQTSFDDFRPMPPLIENR